MSDINELQLKIEKAKFALILIIDNLKIDLRNTKGLYKDVGCDNVVAAITLAKQTLTILESKNGV